MLFVICRGTRKYIFKKHYADDDRRSHGKAVLSSFQRFFIKPVPTRPGLALKIGEEPKACPAPGRRGRLFEEMYDPVSSPPFGAPAGAPDWFGGAGARYPLTFACCSLSPQAIATMLGHVCHNMWRSPPGMTVMAFTMVSLGVKTYIHVLPKGSHESREGTLRWLASKLRDRSQPSSVGLVR